jgi:hypothetical protein
MVSNIRISVLRICELELPIQKCFDMFKGVGGNWTLPDRSSKSTKLIKSPCVGLFGASLSLFGICKVIEEITKK